MDNIPVPQFLSVLQEGTSKQVSFTYTDVGEGYLYNIYRNGVKVYGPIAYQTQNDDQIDWNTQYIYSLTSVLATDPDQTESAHSLPVTITLSPVGLPFATVDDLTNYWKAPDNPARAEYLIRLASNRLRSLAGSTVNLDTKSNTDPLYRDALQGVVLEAVKRALLTPQDQPAAESWQQTAGPYSENIKYSNPAGDLFFKKSELSLLGLTGGQTLNSISTAPNRDIYQERLEADI